MLRVPFHQMNVDSRRVSRQTGVPWSADPVIQGSSAEPHGTCFDATVLLVDVSSAFDRLNTL